MTMEETKCGGEAASERLRRLKKICDVWQAAACSSVVEFLMQSETTSLVGGPPSKQSSHLAGALVSARSDDTRAPDSPAPFKWNRLKIPPCRIQDEARTSVVLWMGRVIEAMCWPMGTFFTAVHALDTVLSVTTGDPLIPLLSTACVLVGVSSECDHKQVAKARRFVGRVPNVRSVSEIVCKQLAVVAALQRGSLVNKTPLDFLMIFLAAAHIVLETEYNVPFWNVCIDLGAETAAGGGSLVDYILALPPPADGQATAPPLAEEDGALVGRKTAAVRTEPSGCYPLVECIIDFVLALAVHCYLRRQYIVVRGSHFVAAVIMDILVHFHPHFMEREKTDSSLREAALERFCLKVFRMPIFEIQPMWSDLGSLYKEAASGDAPLLTTPAGRFFQWPSAAQAMLKKMLEN